MKTKILTMAIALFISGTIAMAQTNATTAKTTSSQQKTQQDSVRYCCSVHKEVKESRPGKCPKCGMALEKRTTKMNTGKKDEMAKVYSCPMHTDVQSNQPGKCPRCEMDLIERK